MTATMTSDATGNVATAERTGSETLGGKYLTFKIDKEEYGVEILKIREIIKLMDITAVPRMPTFMKGVVNLRGKVIPIISLRQKFGLSETDYTDETCIVVVEVGREIGVIVDGVSEVLDISAESIEPPPTMGTGVRTDFILGMGKVGDAIKILLDIDQVLCCAELGDLGDLAELSPGDDETDEVI